MRSLASVRRSAAFCAIAALGLSGCKAPAPDDETLPPDAGFVGDASPRPLAVITDRVSDRVELYSIDPLAEVAEWSVHEDETVINEPFDLALSPDRESLYVVLGHPANYTQGTLDKFRLADGAKLGEVTLGEEPSMIALSRDGTRAYVTLFRNLAHPHGPWTDPGALVVVDTASMAVLGQADVCAAALGVALDEDHHRAWVCCLGAPDANAVAIVDVSDDRAPAVSRTIALAPNAGAAYVLLDAAHAFVTTQIAGDLYVFDRSSFALSAHLAFGSDSFPQRMALTTDGAFVLVAVDGASEIDAVSTAALLVLDRVPLAGFHPQGIAVTPDGQHALFTDESDLVHDGRVARLSLAGLGQGGAHVDATAAAHVFPQPILVAP